MGRYGLTPHANDRDGDTASLSVAYAADSIEELQTHLSGSEAYIYQDGSLRTSVKVDTLELLLNNLTGDPVSRS